MKQLIKAAIVYVAQLPSADALAEHLAEMAFTELQPTQTRSVGFVAPSMGGLVTEFPGGLAFRVRIDEKIIPASAVQKEVAKRAEAWELTGQKAGKKVRQDLKDDVLLDFAKTAFARTSAITCFYERETNYLIVPTTGRRLSDMITSALVGAVGSVKTETINVSNVKHGLTKRLTDWLGGEDSSFGPFDPCGEAALAQEKRKVTVKMGGLQAASSGLKEALAGGFEVTSLGFTHDGQTEFRLTHDFHLRGIEFSHPPTEEDDLFIAEAALEVSAVSAIVAELCDMLGYAEPAAVALDVQDAEVQS